MEVPPDSLQREEVSKNDLGRRSPWWDERKEGAIDLKPLAKQGGGEEEAEEVWVSRL